MDHVVFETLFRGHKQEIDGDNFEMNMFIDNAARRLSQNFGPKYNDECFIKKLVRFLCPNDIITCFRFTLHYTIFWI